MRDVLVRARVAILTCLVSSGALAEDSVPAVRAAGKSLFAENCAVCHGAAGAGTPSLAPPLTHYPAQYATTEEGRRQLAMTVLYGMFGDVEVDQKHFNFKMPDFAQWDDSKLATVLNFVVFDIAKAPSETRPLEPHDIAHERAHAADGQAVREHRQAVIAQLGLAK
jgi:hypothetical protein